MPENTNNGYCHCGCGEKTTICLHDSIVNDYVKGKPVRFIAGHQSRGKNNPKWIGGRVKRSDGYIYIFSPGHHRTGINNYAMEHILVVEKALGKPFSSKHEVHHVDGIRYHNFNKNLVLCEDVAYHRLLHKRERALKACGHADWKKCVFCGKWDDIKNMSVNCQGTAYHLSCVSENNKSRRIINNIGKPSRECNTRNGKTRRDNKSGVKGVGWVKRSNVWKAEITIKGKYSFLGQYDDFDDAVCARLAAEQCLWTDEQEYSSPAYQYVQKYILTH